MERITLFIRTTKTTGKIKLRFRLTEGRGVQLYHKSQIEADLADLKKFEADGSLKPRVSIYNEQLHADIQQEIGAMCKAYKDLKAKSSAEITAEQFETAVDMILNPDKYNLKLGKEKETLIERFNRYMEFLAGLGTLSKATLLKLRVDRDKLLRYLTIFKKTKYTINDFTADDIMNLRTFIINEYEYVPKHPEIYKGLNRRSVPTKPATNNTAASKLQGLKLFFNELEYSDEIQKSPFRRLSRAHRSVLLKERYSDPYYLYREEVVKIMNTDVPDELKETKDAFLLQCAIGCRMGDYKELSMENVSVTPEGIPYIHYIANKTVGTESGRREKTTPLMFFALEIIKRTQFKFDVFNETSWKYGYNSRIKELLTFCGIDREIAKFDDVTKSMKRIPLNTIASSKLCRKTHVDIATKVQVNMYATGLHEAGSAAVEHYSKLEIKDLFVLMCVAFNQPQYKVDKDLNVIEVPRSPANTEIETKI